MARAAASKSEVKFEVNPQGFRELLQRTAEFDKKQAGLLRKNIRTAGKTLLRYVAEEVMSGEYATDKGMRAGIAAGLKLQISTSQSRPGVTLRATSSAMPAGKEPMVKAWQKKATFRHPVFGDTEAWADQQGHPYFYKPVYEHRDILTKAVNDAMQQAAAFLAGGNG